MAKPERLTELERVMLSGEPVTYSAMCDRFAQGMNNPGDVPDTFRRARDRGWISKEPDPNRPTSIRWTATPAGRRALEEATDADR